jgi:hypothetical protein
MHHPTSPFRNASFAGSSTVGQGLTLVHFSAQPQPFWSVSRLVSSLRRVMTHISTEGNQRIVQKVLRLS